MKNIGIQYQNYFKYFQLPIQYDFFISVTDIIADPIIGTALAGIRSEFLARMGMPMRQNIKSTWLFGYSVIRRNK